MAAQQAAPQQAQEAHPRQTPRLAAQGAVAVRTAQDSPAAQEAMVASTVVAVAEAGLQTPAFSPVQEATGAMASLLSSPTSDRVLDNTHND